MSRPIVEKHGFEFIAMTTGYTFIMLAKLFVIFCAIYLGCIAALYIDSSEPSDIKAEVGIVYGNKVELTGQPSERLAARLDVAIYLYQQGSINQILVSGGVGIEGFDEAQVMQAYLLNKGVASAHIMVDSQGNNSHLTAVNATKILQDNSSVVAISQRFHLSRAKLSLRHAGFTQVYGFAPNYHELRDVYSYIREVPAWLKYWWFGL